jgi:biopolymer transport protein ExbD
MDNHFKSNILPALAILFVIFIYFFSPFNSHEKPIKSPSKEEKEKLKNANDSLNLVTKEYNLKF